MGVKYFFNRTVTVSRLKTISGNKKGFSSTATVDASIQVMERTARQEQGIVEGKAWIAYFEEQDDIQEGDKLTDDKGFVYKALEVNTYDVGINRHKAVILVEYNA